MNGFPWLVLDSGKKNPFMFKFYEMKFLLKGNTLKTYTHFPKLIIMVILEKRRVSFCFVFLRLENKDVFC